MGWLFTAEPAMIEPNRISVENQSNNPLTIFHKEATHAFRSSEMLASGKSKDITFAGAGVQIYVQYTVWCVKPGTSYEQHKIILAKTYTKSEAVVITQEDVDVAIASGLLMKTD